MKDEQIRLFESLIHGKTLVNHQTLSSIFANTRGHRLSFMSWRHSFFYPNDCDGGGAADGGVCRQFKDMGLKFLCDMAVHSGKQLRDPCRIIIISYCMCDVILYGKHRI